MHTVAEQPQTNQFSIAFYWHASFCSWAFNSSRLFSLSLSLPFIPVRSLPCSSYLFVFVVFLYFYLFILYVQSAVAATAASAIESKSRMLYCYDCCYRCYCFDHFYCSNNSQTKLPRKNKREQKKTTQLTVLWCKITHSGYLVFELSKCRV